ncbi:MAG: hypothetical protein WA895_09260, partial [Streptosporangiaceae bacterium]
MARLIERNCDEVLYLRGEAATIQRWLSALPADLVPVPVPAPVPAPAGAGLSGCQQRPRGGDGA